MLIYKTPKQIIALGFLQTLRLLSSLSQISLRIIGYAYTRSKLTRLKEVYLKDEENHVHDRHYISTRDIYRIS